MATTSVYEPGMQGGVQYDEKGRPYILMGDGRRNYISPAAFGEPVPEDTTGMFRQGPQWNNWKGEWETPIDWTNVANMATIGGLTAGVGNALMAGGAPAATGGTATVAPSTAGVGTSTTAGISGSTAGMGGSTAGGVLPSTSLPVGLTTAPSAGAAVNTGAAGGGILSTLGSQFKNDPLGTLGSIGDRLGAGASGAAQGRRDDSYAQANVGRVNLDALALDQKRAVLRSLLGGLQDATVNRPAGSTIPNFSVSGGLRPSALSNKDALMAELSRPSPTVEMPKPGTGEKLMGGVGSVLGVLGSLGKLRRPSPATPPFNPNAGGY
jgi:hypothetical protein